MELLVSAFLGLVKDRGGLCGRGFHEVHWGGEVRDEVEKELFGLERKPVQVTPRETQRATCELVQPFTLLLAEALKTDVEHQSFNGAKGAEAFHIKQSHQGKLLGERRGPEDAIVEPRRFNEGAADMRIPNEENGLSRLYCEAFAKCGLLCADAPNENPKNKERDETAKAEDGA